MNDTTLFKHRSVPLQALAFDLDAQYRRLRTIPDHRDLRGRQNPLAMVLMMGVLNNTVLRLFARQGATNVAHARHECAYHFEKALASW